MWSPAALRDIAILFAALLILCLVPGMALVAPLRQRLGGVMYPVIASIVGFASFTIFADLCTRAVGENLVSFLIAPPLVGLLLGGVVRYALPSDNDSPKEPELNLTGGQALACFLFALIVILQFVPIHRDDVVWWGVPEIDYHTRVPVARTIASHGLPPINPSYAPFGAQPLFYYFGYFMFPAAVVRYMGTDCTTTVIALTVFPAFCLPALCAALANRLTGRIVGGWIALGLMFVSGLDCLIIRLLWKVGEYRIIMDRWNPAFVQTFSSFLAWTPHHSIATVDVLTAVTLTSIADQDRGWIRQLRLVPAIVVVIAACGITSTYVGMVLFAWYGIDALILLWRRQGGWPFVVLASFMAGVIILPFYLYLFSVDRHRGPSLVLAMRPFVYDEVVAEKLGFPGALVVYRTLMLPVQYFLEFGFWWMVAWAWAIARWGLDDPRGIFRRLLVMSVVALVIGSTLSSVRVDHDLSWRVLHPLQATLVPVGAAFALAGFSLAAHGRNNSRLLVILLLGIGLASGICDLVRYRFDYLGPHLSWRTRNATRAEKVAPFIHANTPTTARIQHNPVGNDFWLLYLERPIPMADQELTSAIFGVDPKEHAVVLAELQEIFATSVSVDRRRELVQKYRLDFVTIEKEDAVFGRKPAELFGEGAKSLQRWDDCEIVDVRPLVKVDGQKPKASQ